MDYKSISFLVFSLCLFSSGYAEEAQNNVTCTACEITVEALEEYINFGHNEEAIIGNLTEVEIINYWGNAKYYKSSQIIIAFYFHSRIAMKPLMNCLHSFAQYF